MNRYIFPVLLVLFAVGLYLFEIDPMLTDVKQIEAETLNINDNITKAHDASTRLAELSQKLDAFPSGALDRLTHIAPDTLDPLLYLIKMNRIAELHGLTLRNAQVSDAGAPKSGAPYHAHEMTFSVQAPYKVFREFLRDLERSLELHDISNVGFSVSEGAPGAGKPNPALIANPELTVFTYNMTITTYSLH